MQQKTQEYVQTLLQMSKMMIRDEFRFIHQKNEFYNLENSEKILEILEFQKTQFTKITRHLRSFSTYKTIIAKEIISTSTSNLHSEQQDRLNTLLYKETFLIGFLLKHTDKFLKILEHQEKSLKSSNNILQFIRKKTKNTFHTYLEKEEQIYTEFLSLFIQKTKTIEYQSNYLKKHELYESIQNYILKGSITLSALPLGPLELLSLPLWGTYLSMREIEHHKKEFEEWRKIKKQRITK